MLASLHHTHTWSRRTPWHERCACKQEPFQNRATNTSAWEGADLTAHCLGSLAGGSFLTAPPKGQDSCHFCICVVCVSGGVLGGGVWVRFLFSGGGFGGGVITFFGLRSQARLSDML